MKNYFIVFVLIFIFSSSVSGYDRVYIQQTPYPIYNSYGYCYPECYINRPPYNPYWIQKNVNYSNNSYTNAKKLQRIKKLQRLRNYANQLSWLSGNNNGSLTGYSVPVTKDIYKQMGITPFDSSNKIKNNSPTCNQELFSIPMGNETYYKNGNRYTDLKGASGKTGVTIIYD